MDSHLKIREVRLKPEYVRQRHLGPVTGHAERARIKVNAELMVDYVPSKKFRRVLRHA